MPRGIPTKKELFEQMQKLQEKKKTYKERELLIKKILNRRLSVKFPKKPCL
jgi:hypothetical protein